MADPTPAGEAMDAAKRIIDWVELSGEGPPDAWPTTCADAVLVARALLSLSEWREAPKTADAKRIAVDLLEAYPPPSQVSVVCNALLGR